MKTVLREWATEWKGVVLYGIIAVVLAGTLYFNAAERSQTQEALEKVALETHTALCTFTNDLERRLEDTLRYMKNHPSKEPIPGISRADLRRSVQNQRLTLKSLAVLRCDEPHVIP